MTFPKKINIGSGKNFIEDHLNIDFEHHWQPDILFDLNMPFPEDCEASFATVRFGNITIQKGYFKKIIANDVLEHLTNLTVLMKSCLDLLAEGGLFEINVPYDLSLGAWQDPTHIRAFNENSWLYYTDWFWYLGWTESRFVLDQDIIFQLSKYGRKLQESGKNVHELIRLPRAVDSMNVVLKKRQLNQKDQLQLEHFRGKIRRPLSQETITNSHEVHQPVPQNTAMNVTPVKDTATELVQSFCIWLVSPSDYEHTNVFLEIAQSLQSGFRQLGIDAPIITSEKNISGTAIVIGCNLIPMLFLNELPKNLILFNLEQILKDSPWMTQPYIDLLKSNPVWDYSRTNIAEMEKMAITGATYCGIGYEPELSIIQESAEDIDVLFYGSLNQRRLKILEELKEQGVNVVNLFGVYGNKRDLYISRAKIVINIHYYESRVFEIIRVSYLLANKQFVLSETGMEKEIEKRFFGGVAFAEYDGLVEQCLFYLSHEKERKAIAKKGFEIFSAKSQAEYLQTTLGLLDSHTGEENPSPDTPKNNGQVELQASSIQEPSTSDQAGLYLDLMEKCLTNTIYEDRPQDLWSGHIFDKEKREKGLDWPSQAHTMIGGKRMKNLRLLVEKVLLEEIPGDFIETGIWRGGACIFMRSILKAYGIKDRTIWCADSFQGLPEPESKRYPHDAGDQHYTYDQLRVSLKEVRENFKKYNLLDDQVKFLKGWFKDTLPAAPIKRLAVLRLDGDLYQSTMEGFKYLYNKVSNNGFIIVDDYGAVAACRKAVTDFRKKMSIDNPINDIDGIGVWWRKT